MSEPTDPLFRTVTLDSPIQRGETTIDKLQLRKPRSGELRGLSLVDLGQLKVDALTKVLPRITVPPLTVSVNALLESPGVPEPGLWFSNVMPAQVVSAAKLT